MTERILSRQGQLLKVTQWLFAASGNELLPFLNQLASELNQNSASSVVSFLLIKNPSILSNDSLDNILDYCNSTPTTSSQLKPYTRNKNAFPLLSLHSDIIDLCGLYLSKKDGIELGLSCRALYCVTQRVSFLHNNNASIRIGESNAVRLNRRNFQKIHDSKMDLWACSVNCKKLIFCETQNDAIVSKYQRLRFNEFWKRENSARILKCAQVLKTMQSTKYYTKWFEKIFENVDYLIATGLGVDLLTSVVPTDILFSISKMNKKTQEIVKIDRNPLNLSIDWNSHEVNFLSNFAQKYHEFFMNECSGQLTNIRPIGNIEFVSELTHDMTNGCDLFGENYTSLTFHDMNGLKIDSMDTFKTLFHPRLTRLQANGVYFDEKTIFTHCRNLGRVNGHRLSMLDIFNAMNDGTCQDWIKSLISDEEKNAFIQQVTPMIGLGIYDPHRQESWSNQYAAETWYDEFAVCVHKRADAQRKFYPDDIRWIYYKLVNGWCVDLIDRKEIEFEQINCPISNIKELEIGSLRMKDNVNDDNYHNLKNSKHYRPKTNSYTLLNTFDKSFRNSLCYKLLNWQNSVEILTLSFWTDIFDEKDNFSFDNHKCGFERAMNDMMQYFDKIRHLSIKILFDTSIQTSDSDGLITMNDYNFTINSWLDFFCEQFRKYFEAMKSKGNKEVFYFDIELVLGNGVQNDGKLWNDIDFCYREHFGNTAPPIDKEVFIGKSIGQEKEDAACQHYCDNLQKIKHRMVWCLENVDSVANGLYGSKCQAVFACV